MGRLFGTILILLSFSTTFASSSRLSQGHGLFEIGGFFSHQGKVQNIHIQGLIGDRFNITNDHGSNVLIGLGYLIDGPELANFRIDYGINAYYLPKTTSSGTIDQELLFTNLAYSYKVTHFPIYATSKMHIKTRFDKYMLTLHSGVGPNFIQTHHYQDWSIDNGITLPDHAFSGRNNMVLSAMAGIGLKVNDVFGKIPLECGYRFFYLGEGHFNRRTNQLLNSLNTGLVYANAVMCAVSI